MTSATHITKIAIVGASGNVGSYITSSLLSTSKFTLTALTRADSTATFPASVQVAKIDYTKPETVVQALKGQEALIITLGVQAGDAESKLVKAAGEAGVKFILNNEWCPDSENVGLGRDVPLFQHRGATRKEIAELGKSSYISVGTGFWYEWSLAIPDAFGFDIQNRKVTFFDDGETKISTSTWPQVGRAVASLLSLPLQTLTQTYSNRLIHVSSFTVSQKQMFASLLRVTNTSESDWQITYEPTTERFDKAKEEVAQGNFRAYAKLMYTRVFYKDGTGDLTGRLEDEKLGLVEEDLDEATGRAVERSKVNPFGYSQ
ncbi:hypothetical protein HK097_009476 [Rhizophlyctis rosea]|uniref:NmrA-like domain-containing protein n=1 Tax=Rhizophlyctis rosea TaxID=64517 RepID=A0AAD5SJ38_9FUNG|nr:hypothetical protein HK097_009476 [Rhizophlyctis rosea]